MSGEHDDYRAYDGGNGRNGDDRGKSCDGDGGDARENGRGGNGR